MSRYEIITFDCYGTLIDWEEGIARAFLAAASGHDLQLNADRILAAYHQVEPMVEAEEFRSYREILRETARRVGRTFGWEAEERELDLIPQSLPQWKPFADTNSALEQLRDSGFALAILSNVDDDLIAGTLKNFSVDFEFVITAQQVRSYKPELGHFVSARSRIGGRRWLHAAQSYFHDVVPARALDIPVAWINRKSAPPEEEVRPDFEYSNLTEFARAMSLS